LLPCPVRGRIVFDEVHPIERLPTFGWSGSREALADIVFGSERETHRAARRNAGARVSNAVPNLAECDAAEPDSVFGLLLMVANLATSQVLFGCGLRARTPSPTTHLRIRSAISWLPGNAGEHLQQSLLNTS
jgi:hypothetical protein